MKIQKLKKTRSTDHNLLLYVLRVTRKSVLKDTDTDDAVLIISTGQGFDRN